MYHRNLLCDSKKIIRICIPFFIAFTLTERFRFQFHTKNKNKSKCFYHFIQWTWTKTGYDKSCDIDSSFWLKNRRENNQEKTKPYSFLCHCESKYKFIYNYANTHFKCHSILVNDSQFSSIFNSMFVIYNIFTVLKHCLWKCCTERKRNGTKD